MLQVNPIGIVTYKNSYLYFIFLSVKFIDFEKAYDSIKRESLYVILIKFGVPKN